MARRTILPVLALSVLLALLLPTAAFAVVRLAVVTDQRTGVKRMEVGGGIGNDDIRLVQEDQPNTPAIAVFIPPSESVQLGAGCRTLANPARARCDTRDVAQIFVNLSEGTRSPSTFDDTNAIDLTGVTQLTPDASAPLPTVLIGGPGPDTVTDGPGRLQASMLGGRDVVNAGGGNDDIDDGPGNDTILGGEGDDRFGDFHTPGSDIISGGPGRDSVIARGVVTLNDLLCNDGANADGPGQFPAARSVVAPEGRLECSGTGADRDLIVGVEAVAQVFDDSAVDFTGSGADELLQGNANFDRLEGGGGRDSLLGLEGSDLLLARDGAEDALTDCGEGRGDDDRAVVDAVDPVEPNCETIERGGAGLEGPVGGGQPAPVFPGFPEAPPPSPSQGNQPSSTREGSGPGGGDGRTPPDLEIPTRVAFVKSNRIQIRVRCIYRARNCVGRLTLTAAQTRRAGRVRVSRGALLASGRVNVPWGTSRSTTMRAPRSLVRLLRALRGQRTLKVRATVVARDSGGGRRARSATARRTVTLGLQR